MARKPTEATETNAVRHTIVLGWWELVSVKSLRYGVYKCEC